MKAIKTIFVFLAIGIGAVCFLLFLLWFFNRPPGEAKIIRNFNAHRTAFEHLRDKLTTDREVRRVAHWGVETTNSLGASGNFPPDRYKQYVALLDEAHVRFAYRLEGDRPNPGICVWAHGFAGDIRHIWIIWDEEKPANLSTNLDFYEAQGPSSTQIDGNWYLSKDW